MLPTLRSVVALGGSAAYADIDKRAILEAGITDEQLAIEYDEDAASSGPKILHRIAWARSMLKRIGALEGAGHGVWASTPDGTRLSELSNAEAIAEIDQAVARAYEAVEPTPGKLLELRDRALADDAATVTVRELIRMWGVNRRRSSVIERVNRTLDAAGLATDPDFTVGSLDSTVAIVARSEDDEPESAVATAIGQTTDDHEPANLVVGNIPSATGGIKAVNPNDDLVVAHSEMQAHDYSQLAVMEGKYKLIGAISWESIAKSLLINPLATLACCIEPNPAVVRVNQPLLDAVPAISRAGYVFVKDGHNQVTGIITTADLTDQFTLLTRPFLLLGEIEIVIRSAINHEFNAEDLFEATNPNNDRVIEGAESLTLGEIQRFISNVHNFDRLGWAADRNVVNRQLGIVRRIRNEVMHFSPDPLDDTDLKVLSTFLDWVRDLHAQRASA